MKVDLISEISEFRQDHDLDFNLLNFTDQLTVANFKMDTLRERYVDLHCFAHQ